MQEFNFILVTFWIIKCSWYFVNNINVNTSRRQSAKYSNIYDRILQSHVLCLFPYAVLFYLYFHNNFKSNI